jgi:Mce-associated membrane protein
MARTDARSDGSVSAVTTASSTGTWDGWDDVAVDLPPQSTARTAPAEDTPADETPAPEAPAPEVPAEEAPKKAAPKAGKKAAPKSEKKAGKAGKTGKTGKALDPAARRFRLVATTAVVLVVAALAAAVTAGVLFVQGRTLEANREGALAAGRQAAVNLTSVNFTTADADVRRVLDSSTGDFAALFGQNIDSYTGIVKEGRVVSTGEVAGAAVQSVGSDTARVLAAVNSKVQNSQLPAGESRNYRMAMDMVLGEDGVWRVAKMEFIP